MAPGLSIGTSAFTTQPWMTPTNIGMFSPMSIGTSIYSTGTSSSSSSSSYGTANETAEQREKRIERELKNKNEATTTQARKAAEINPKVLKTLTEEEQKILLEYMDKINAQTHQIKFLDSSACGAILPCIYTLRDAAKEVPVSAVTSTAATVEATGAAEAATGFRGTVKNALGKVDYQVQYDKALAKAVEKGKTVGEFGTTVSKYGNALTKGLTSKGTAVFVAVGTVLEDVGDLTTAYKDSFGSGLKQTGQTAVKAGAAGVGFWAGAKAGAAGGAALGGLAGPVGAAIGGAVGAIIGGLVGCWGGKKLATAAVGKNVGAKIREGQAVEVATADKDSKLNENNLASVQSVLQFAQTDVTADEKTMAVLNKLQQVTVTA